MKRIKKGRGQAPIFSKKVEESVEQKETRVKWEKQEEK